MLSFLILSCLVLPHLSCSFFHWFLRFLYTLFEIIFELIVVFLFLL
ncbi:hypothetical protein MtrunA17_Chr5g0393921 [Medicago truncatula]|uniref:Transmembrane protein n=1 Tax=Medicago truncatula TaxID=3880 RepID=A0A396HN13_MEDTR|nr:hypothetical protein MtrunA17_Chr5g0393921 [Medicago truncatula]